MYANLPSKKEAPAKDPVDWETDSDNYTVPSAEEPLDDSASVEIENAYYTQAPSLSKQQVSSRKTNKSRMSKLSH